MENPENISFVMAFLAGVLTFFSPCILPLIPSYISYLTGVTFKELSDKSKDDRQKKVREKTVIHSLSFIIGFTIIFVILGTTATFLGKALYQVLPLLKKIGGIFIIFFSLVIMGVIKIPFLQKQKKLEYHKKSVSTFGSIIVGMTFALAWTPCVGPILGSILIYASSQKSLVMGIKLLIAYSMGLAVPFFLSALLINSFISYVKKIERHMRKIEITAGVILLIFGIFLLKGGY